MKWLDEIEHQCFPQEEDALALAPTPDQARKLIAAVRLAEKEAKFLSDDLSTSARVIAMARISSLVIRLRSGDVEEKP